MELKKGYKQTEVGVIPEGWNSDTLGPHTLKVGSGITPTGGEKVYTEEGRPFLRSQNIGWGKLHLKDIAFIDDETHSTFKATEIKDKDVFLNITGASIGRSAVADQRVEKGNVNQHVCIIRPVEDQLNPHFLNYFLLSSKGQKQIDSFQAGGNRQGLNFGQIKSFKIPLPLPPEQIAIATALSDVDDLIASLEKLIAKKKNIKQGTMQQLLTGKKRLPGFTGKREIKKLGDIANITMGQSPKSVFYNTKGIGLPLIQGNADIDNRKTISRVFTSAITKRGQNGNIIMSVRAPVGEIARATFDCCLGRGVCAISYRNGFLYHLLIYLEKEWVRLSKGSTFDSINSKEVKELELLVPLSDEEQTAIAQILNDMDAETETLEQKRDKYKDIKQGMTQELLTGRIRLIQQKGGGVPMTTAMKASETTDASPKKAHNWQINEAVVIAVLTGTFGSEQYPLGRKRYTKFSYLLHRHVEGKAEGYRKKAAGPYNPDTKYKGPEKIAQDNRYIKRHATGKFSGFVADESIEQARKYFDKWYGGEVFQWLEQFRFESNEQLELLTTVDMAVCELAESKQAVSVKGIKNVIRSHPEWKAKLNQPFFSDEGIAAAIEKAQELFGV